MAGKVLYISYDGMTDQLGQSQVIPYLQGLSKHGYKITMLSFEKKEKFEKQSEYIKDLLAKSGIDWHPLFFSRRPPYLSKLYDVWHMKNTAARLHRIHKFDFVHCRSYIPAGAGLHLSRKFGVPFLMDMRGFWVDERVDNGQWDLRNPFFRYFYKRYKKIERAYFDESRHVISLTWKGRDELMNTYGVPPDKITVIPCCVDLEHFDYKKISESAILDKKNQLGIHPGETVISYLGSLGGWYLERDMLDFFAEMKTSIPGAKFLFITQDPPRAVFNAVAQTAAPADDIIVQHAYRNEVPLYLALSNWSIFFIKDAYSKKASSPTKQGEIMAMGIPIICNDIGDTGKIIEASGAGALVRGFNKEEYKKVVRTVPGLQEIRREKIRDAAFEYYDLDKGIQLYQGVYKLMMGRNKLL